MSDFKIKIDRASSRTLTDQIVRGVRSAIFDGSLATGTVLPSRERMAKVCGVSVNVIREALSRLAADGLVRARPHIGCEVLRRSKRKMTGRVLRILGENDGSYMWSVMTAALQRELNAAGLRCSQVSVTTMPNGRSDYTGLKEALSVKPDVAVVCACNMIVSSVVRILERYDVPYVLVLSDVQCGGRNCLKDIPFDGSEAIRAFVDDCRRRRILSVCQFGFGKDSLFNSIPLLQKAGIATEEIVIPLKNVLGELEAIQRLAADAMARRLGCGPLSELIFFTDDYLTLGAVPVLLERGVRIPQDVKVVSLANRGFGPVFPKRLTRIETDCLGDAERIARSIIGWMRTDNISGIDSISPRYLLGETF